MASLNRLARAFIDSVEQPFNIGLLERVKFHIKHYRAKFIRQDFERNGISRNIVQSYVDNLIKVDELDNCIVDIGCTILKTKNKVPKPVQTKGNLFQRVGSVNYKGLAWGELTPNELLYIKHNIYTSKAIYFHYTNDYIYVYGNKKLKYIRIDGVFEDPYEALTKCVDGADCVTDDDEFPISLHMVDLIYKEMRNHINNILDDKEVTTNIQH